MSHALTVVVSRNSDDKDGDSPQERLESVASALLQTERPAARLLFYTEGLSWLLKDSAMLPQLQELEARGVELLVCKTCVKECGLQDELGAGTMETDDRIIELMWNADHVVVV